MNLYEQYLFHPDKEYRKCVLSMIQHRLKQAGESGNMNEIDCLLKGPDIDLDQLEEKYVRELAKIAVDVDYLCNKYFGFWPSWTGHPRLKLDEPYFDKYFEPIDIFICPQEMLNHNYFCDVNSLETI